MGLTHLPHFNESATNSRSYLLRISNHFHHWPIHGSGINRFSYCFSSRSPSPAIFIANTFYCRIVILQFNLLLFLPSSLLSPFFLSRLLPSPSPPFPSSLPFSFPLLISSDTSYTNYPTPPGLSQSPHPSLPFRVHDRPGRTHVDVP